MNFLYIETTFRPETKTVNICFYLVNCFASNQFDCTIIGKQASCVFHLFTFFMLLNVEQKIVMVQH